MPLEISYRVGSKRSLAAFSTISRGGQYVHSASMFAHIRADTIEESWPGIIEATERRFGRLDVMVANAGIGILCKAVEMSLADRRRQTAVPRWRIPVGDRPVAILWHWERAIRGLIRSM